ncbi:MAG: hypothetical protein CO184_01640 [Candidatus Zambryskibacteria bacterium CG_4_9_14_3_um_filter_40_16]|uniref:Uncharacterized protein n=2 Tax=Candidatus Zambryskiibacteriota TaxID=1817925 RepID=A0A2H0K7B0_9BACT|nr:MAG: hypothetical protein COV95_00325 [Candidatus Zambryskibacteria bacterium CG11_big_fil_rev_8_21_14_0_20_40_24]PJA33552.1 MAG: hypothetical protein CO184_01640 [Candidatus Zambryskibacteria bacterium CG_4_9_14_3_um_filter_40_16]
MKSIRHKLAVIVTTTFSACNEIIFTQHISIKILQSNLYGNNFCYFSYLPVSGVKDPRLHLRRDKNLIFNELYMNKNAAYKAALAIRNLRHYRFRFKISLEFMNI